MGEEMMLFRNCVKTTKTRRVGVCEA